MPKSNNQSRKVLAANIENSELPVNTKVVLSAEELIAAEAASRGMAKKNEKQQNQTETKSFTKEELEEFAASVATKAVESAQNAWVSTQQQSLESEKIKEAEEEKQKAEEIANNAAKVVSAAENEALSAKEKAEQAAKEAEAAKQKLEDSLKQNQRSSEVIAQLQEDVKKLQGLSSLYGVSNSMASSDANILDNQGRQFGEAPNLNLNTNPLTGPVGIAKTLVDILQSAPAQQVSNPRSGTVAIQRDLKEFKNHLARIYLEDRVQGKSYYETNLFSCLEQSLKNEGLLRGRNVVTNAAGPTIGTPGSVGVLYLDILAAWSRLTHNATNIWWQFPIQVYDPSTIPSLTMGIPRWEYLTEADDINDYLLATTTTYTSTPVSVGSGSDSQALVANTVPVAIAEWGLGKSVGIETRPVFIPEFHEQTSLLSLMGALDSRLMQSYYRFENKKIRLEYEKATGIVYNDAGYVTTTPGDVATNDDGTFTEAFASSLYTEMFAQQIPTLPDGCYILALNPTAANQYKASLQKIYSPVTEEQRMEISNIFAAATGVEIGRVNSYFGKYNNFHCFIGNDFGVGAPGSVPTVNDVIFGAGVTACADSFAFGPGAVGRGIALAAEIRASGTNPFGRGESYIWLSREETAPIDLDSTLDPNQQTRCLRARTALRPV